MKPESPKLTVKSLLVPFLVPTLVGKTFILYFGLNYSDHPGEGYGIGLTCAVLFTVTMLSRFIWKFRNYKDE